jgi:hypothetical protein
MYRRPVSAVLALGQGPAGLTRQRPAICQGCAPMLVVVIYDDAHTSLAPTWDRGSFCKL